VNHIAGVDPYYHYEIYQSYSCLFGTVITINANQLLADHKCEKASFGEEAATLMYKFIQPLLKDKIGTRNFRVIAKDLKDCLEMIIEVFPSPPKISKVTHNLTTLQSFLGKDIDCRLLNPKNQMHLELYDIMDNGNMLCNV
jgi:hypothetical protein